MAIRLYRSQAQPDTKTTNVSAQPLNVSPSSVYNYSKSAGAAGDAGVKLAILIKKTADDNKASAIKSSLTESLAKTQMNVERSADINDIAGYQVTNSLIKDKLLIGQNTAVKNKVNSWFKSHLASSSIEVEKNITKNAIDLKKFNDKQLLNNAHKTISNPNATKFESNEAKDLIAGYFLNPDNEIFYKPAEWAKLKSEQNDKVKFNTAINLATNDPSSLIDNPKIITDHIKDTKAAQYVLEKAYENHAQNIEAEIKDNEIIDAKIINDQVHNFAEIAVRIKAFMENADNPEYSDKLISYSKIKEAYVNNDIDETMYNKLLNYRAGVTTLNDDTLVQAINNEIIESSTSVDLQALSKRIQLKETDLTFLNLSAKETAQALNKINKLKKDTKLYSEYKATLGTLKSIFFTSDTYSFDLGDDSRTVKAIGAQAESFFDNLVMNEGMDVTSALFETIKKFNPGESLPNMTIFPLPAMSEESDWGSLIKAAGGTSYFIKTKDKMANMYKDGKLSHDQFIFEMNNLDKAQKLFNIRHSYAVSISKATDDVNDENVLSFAAGEGSYGSTLKIKSLLKK